MIKYQVGYGLNILFVGINPHPGSYSRSVPFSNNKMFWYLLHDAGIIQEPREVLKNILKLKKIYMNEFKNKYHLGLLNMVDRATVTASKVKRNEAIAGKKRLLNAIKKYKPKVVCFVGKITYNLFIGSSEFSFGWQPDIYSSKVYVMHSPNHGLAITRINDLKEIMKEIRK